MSDIHICLSYHDGNGTYIKPFFTTLISVLENTHEYTIFHIFHDDTLHDQSRTLLENLTNSYACCILFHDMSKFTFTKQKQLLARYSVASLYRLKIPEVLPSDVKKTIYLDGDIICALDIKELWEIALEKQAVAAALDSEKSRNLFFTYFDFSKYMNFEKYFNSGVLILNLDKLRSSYPNLYDDSLRILSEHPEWDAADQNPLNIIFQDDCLFLDNRFNHISVDYRPESVKDLYGFIWHFAGIHKPWVYKNNLADFLYWHYFKKTPFGDTEEKLFIEQRMVKDGTLDNLILTYPLGSRKLFVKRLFYRLFTKRNGGQ